MNRIELYGKIYEWDEQAEAVTMNIRDRKTCFSHDWVNGSLHFEVGELGHGGAYISLESDAKPNFNPEWGRSYGGIRYCRKCKQIDCIHLWEPAPPEDESWRECKHEWNQKSRGSWLCQKCGARYSWMCGCGGSGYVCDRHYEEIRGTVEAELDEKCWGPAVPHIQKCRVCSRKIRRT